MLSFTIAKGKLALSPNIVLFKELQDLYDSKDGSKYLQVIYYLHSADVENPFKDISKLTLERNVLETVFKKSDWKDLKMTKAMQTKYDLAEALFIKHNKTAESRLLTSINKKFDEVSTMLDNTKPIIEESVTRSGETKFNSNLTIILNLFTKIETIMKSKTLLTNAIRKQEGEGRLRGGGTSSFREKNLLGK